MYIRYIYIVDNICICVDVHMYIYIYRERERCSILRSLGQLFFVGKQEELLSVSRCYTYLVCKADLDPDFQRLWLRYMMQQGGVSKATKTINLSEDIFAGMDFTLRGQRGRFVGWS